MNFERETRKHPERNSLTRFMDSVIGRNFKEKDIDEFFEVLVNKKDYKPEDHNKIIEYIYKLNRTFK